MTTPAKPKPKKPKGRPGMPRKRTKTLDAEGLDPRERLFVSFYIGDANYNGAEAARLAGYAVQNARAQASVILRRPYVLAAVQKAMAERTKAIAISDRFVLGELFGLYLAARGNGDLKAAVRVMRDIGEHVGVNAFRKQLGLGSPTGGPIEAVDVAALAALEPEELDQLERARAILDGLAGGAGEAPVGGSAPGGAGAATPAD